MSTGPAGGPSYLPGNRRELLFWLGLVLIGALACGFSSSTRTGWRAVDPVWVSGQGAPGGHKQTLPAQQHISGQDAQVSEPPCMTGAS